MNYIIIPYKGIGDLRFGMPRQEIREILQIKAKTFKKSPLDKLNTDAFYEIGIHVYFKQPDNCEAIELFLPAKPALFELDLLHNHFKTIKNHFLNYDKEIEIDEDGFTSYKYGIGIYAPGHEEDSSIKPESVIVFEKGYYG